MKEKNNAALKEKKPKFFVISGIVRKIYESKLYSKLSPHYGKDIWVIETENNTINVLNEYLEDEDFMKILNTRAISLLSKNFKFIVIQRGKYLVSAEEIKD